MRQEMPNGLRPLDWVYRCFKLATCLMRGNYSSDGPGFRIQTQKILRLPGDVLQGDGVLHGELVRLTLHPCLLDQHTRVSCQA